MLLEIFLSHSAKHGSHENLDNVTYYTFLYKWMVLIMFECFLSKLAASKALVIVLIEINSMF